MKRVLLSLALLAVPAIVLARAGDVRLTKPEADGTVLWKLIALRYQVDPPQVDMQYLAVDRDGSCVQDPDIGGCLYKRVRLEEADGITWVNDIVPSIGRMGNAIAGKRGPGGQVDSAPISTYTPDIRTPTATATETPSP